MHVTDSFQGGILREAQSQEVRIKHLNALETFGLNRAKEGSEKLEDAQIKMHKERERTRKKRRISKNGGTIKRGLLYVLLGCQGHKEKKKTESRTYLEY